MNSGVLAFVLERTFKYGGLWIVYEELEDMRATMGRMGLDTTTVDQKLANARGLMDLYHSEIQARLAAHHLLLGYCEPGLTVCAIDDGKP